MRGLYSAVNEDVFPYYFVTQVRIIEQFVEQLPEDGWTRMARELLEKGELRLALRAFYLASLAHLAGRNLITLAKFKSNRDYERELQRRAHAFAALLAVFGENVALFDRVWYGLHDVNAELVQHFAANVDQLKAGG